MQLDQYIAYLLSTPSHSSCVKASEVLEVSHDEVNRFLLSCDYTGRDLFESVRAGLCLQGGTLTVDDTVLDKPFTRAGTTELVGRFWSGRHHKVVQGVNLLVLVYTQQGHGVPVNFRVYRPAEGMTKNDYFRQMVLELWQWGLRPAWVTADSWYSGLDNRAANRLKFLRNLEVGILMGLEKNRLISTNPSEYQQVGQADIPASGLRTHLRGFDFVAVFRTADTDSGARHYLLYHPDPEYAAQHVYQPECFEQLRDTHWQVEVFFRVIKQVCRADKFYVRTTSAIRTHLFAVLRAFQKLVALRRDGFIDSLYRLRETIYRNAQVNWIINFA